MARSSATSDEYKPLPVIYDDPNNDIHRLAFAYRRNEGSYSDLLQFPQVIWLDWR
ncbi:MAG: hypothetical protein ACFCD0_00350 [Gemmataceae bacterium]